MGDVLLYRRADSNFAFVAEILDEKSVDLLPSSVVTDYDRDRAAGPRLREIQAAWGDLPEFVKESLVFMARGAKEEEEE